MNIAGGFAIAWMYGRWNAIRHALPMILIISLIHGGGQLALVFWNPVVSNFIAGTIVLLVLYPLSTWARYDQPHEDMPVQAMAEDSERVAAQKEQRSHDPVMGLGMATFPYIVLTVVTLGALLTPQIESFLSAFRAGLPFSEVATGYEVVRGATDAYAPFVVFTHPGTFILVAAIISWLVYQARGYYQAWSRIKDQESIWKGVTDGALPASLAVLSFLTMATVTPVVSAPPAPDSLRGAAPVGSRSPSTARRPARVPGAPSQ